MKAANSQLRVVYCAYRPWALLPVPFIQQHSRVEHLTVISSRQEFDAQLDLIPNTTDIVFFVGWSWMIPASFFNRILCIGMHPSDLPRYRGGSPLQHQILDNLSHSMASLFTITDELDGGPIWIKEPFSLAGDSMDIITSNLAQATSRALVAFIDKYPEIIPTSQVGSNDAVLKRRTSSQSRLYLHDFQNKSTLDLYNFIRALTEPYPNAYIEDAKGDKLFFSGVRFEKSKEPLSS